MSMTTKFKNEMGKNNNKIKIFTLKTIKTNKMQHLTKQ